MGDLFTKPPAQHAREIEDSQSKQAKADAYLEQMSPRAQRAAEKAGDNWWLKPKIWLAGVEADLTDDDWKLLGKLGISSGQASDRKPKKAKDSFWHKATSLATAPLRAGRDVALGGLGAAVGAANTAGNAAGGVLKNATRLAGSVAESGYQEVQGMFRSAAVGVLNADQLDPGALTSPKGALAQQTNKHRDPVLAAVRERTGVEGEGNVGSQSSFGVLLGKLNNGEVSWGDVLSGNKKALGSGFLPGGDVEVEQAKRAWRSAHIGKDSLTGGRLLASTVFEPGSLPYEVLSGGVDTGLITFLDPANFALNKIGEAVQARKYFNSESIGLLNGSRRTVTEGVNDFLNSTRGTKYVDRLVKMKSSKDVWLAHGRHLPIEQAVQIAEADSPQAVREALDGVLGFAVHAKPKGWRYAEPGLAWQRKTEMARWLNQMPTAGLVDRHDPQQFVAAIHDNLINAKIDAGTVEQLTNQAMRAHLAGDQYQVTKTTMEAVDAQLRSTGIPGKAAKTLTKLWDGVEALRTYNIDAMTGLERPLPGVTINGTTAPSPTPQMLEQFLGKYIPMPDIDTLREIRTRTGVLGTLASKGGSVGAKALDAEIATVHGLDVFLKTWKPIQIIRGAYIPRVVGDEQARMASAGLSSLFSHPLSYLSVAIADDGRIGRMLDKLPGATTGRLGADVTGAAFSAVDEDTQFAKTLYESLGDMFGDKGRRTLPVRVSLHLRPADGIPADGAVHGWADSLQQLHDNPVARQLASGHSADDVKAWLWDSPYRRAILGDPEAHGGKLGPLAEQLSSRAGADQWVDETMRQWVQDVTQGDPRLVGYVADGHMDGLRLHSNMKVTKEGAAKLETILGEGVGPEFVVGSPSVAVGSKVAGMYDHVINMFADHIMVRPSNWASRSPTFKQYYWQRIEQLLGDASPEARATILGTAADEAKLSRAMRKRLAAIPSGERNLDIDTLNLLANKHAADATKKLLYDLSNRGQSWHALRVAIPFGEAYKEVFTTWGHLLSENPKGLRTVQKTIEGARGAGFFYTDPTTQQEVYTVPGTPQLVQGLMGMKGGSFNAPVSGLSIAGSVIPGFSPVVQWAAGEFLPDKPRYDVLREVIFQYGGEGEGIVNMMVPAWADKLLKWDNSAESDRQFNSAVGEVANYLAGTGDYNLQDPDEMVRLQHDAVDRARDLYQLRGIAQFFAPSAPRPNIKVPTEKGAIVTAALMEEFQKMNDEDHATAYERFVTKFGDDAVLSIVHRSKSNVAGLGSSPEFARFERAHAGLFDKYPEVAGVFAPEGSGLDYTEYERQFRTGKRTTISQRDRVKERNSILARIAYDEQKAKLPAKPNKAQRDWLSQVRDELVEQYPGYNPADFNPGDEKEEVRLLEQMANDKSAKGLPAAKATREYFRFRAQAAASTKLKTWQSSDKTVALRNWLRDVAGEIAQETPEFQRVWDTVLSRELKDDEEAA